MTPQNQSPITGASIIARTLKSLGVTAIFGIVGVPVSDIAEQAINIGIRFIGFRNEQAASYAATGYGYLTGRPGVCLVVGGPGVLHAVAGVRIPRPSFAACVFFNRSQCYRGIKI
jgi:2-hydroxyacyl-CoA lyase 1